MESPVLATASLQAAAVFPEGVLYNNWSLDLEGQTCFLLHSSTQPLSSLVNSLDPRLFFTLPCKPVPAVPLWQDLKVRIPPSPQVENASELVEAICQVIMHELREVVQEKLKIVLEDTTKLRDNTTKVLVHILVCMDSTENILLSAVVTDEVAQLQTDVNVLMKGRNALSNEIDFQLYRAVERLGLLEQKIDTGHWLNVSTRP